MISNNKDNKIINPVLCGGTFFTLLLQARQQESKKRQMGGKVKVVDKTGAPAMLAALIKIVDPSFTVSTDLNGFKPIVSNYKTCKASRSGQLSISEQSTISSFTVILLGFAIKSWLCHWWLSQPI